MFLCFITVVLKLSASGPLPLKPHPEGIHPSPPLQISFRSVDSAAPVLPLSPNRTPSNLLKAIKGRHPHTLGATSLATPLKYYIPCYSRNFRLHPRPALAMPAPSLDISCMPDKSSMTPCTLPRELKHWQRRQTWHFL